MGIFSAVISIRLAKKKRLLVFTRCMSERAWVAILDTLAFSPLLYRKIIASGHLDLSCCPLAIGGDSYDLFSRPNDACVSLFLIFSIALDYI